MNKKENGFTETALAGLAAIEDYTSVKLKQSDTISHLGEYPPFHDLMLIQIKGRRYCQARLVEPRVDSLNNGDCFILVTNNRGIFLLIGEHANIIEKSKANELYDWIRLHKDLGVSKTQTTGHIIDCKSSLIFRQNNFNEDEFNLVQNENFLSHAEQEFLDILNNQKK
jgi:hypothetical protein